MDKLEKYRKIIRNILTEYVNLSASDKSTQTVPVFDSEHDRYLLMVIGRENGKRIHFCLVNLAHQKRKNLDSLRRNGSQFRGTITRK